MGDVTKAIRRLISTNDQRPAKRIRIVVTGRVQGVGFRAYTVSLARELGITGWVRNWPDNRSVEIEAEGDSESLTRFLKRVSHGPPSAHVTKVQHGLQPGNESFTTFSVRY